MTGTVRLKLYKGTATVAGRKSPALALPDRLRHLRGRPGVPPEGRRGVHQPQRPAAQDPRAARSAALGPGRADHARPRGAHPGGVRQRSRSRGGTALVVDVLRASTTVVTACAAGCRQMIPVVDTAGALERRRELPGRGRRCSRASVTASPIAGFDLGNSPLEYTRGARGRTDDHPHDDERDGGDARRRRAAAVAGVAALTNLAAAARWAAAQGRDVTVLCSGEKGRLSLEDASARGSSSMSLAARGGRPRPAGRRHRRAPAWASTMRPTSAGGSSRNAAGRASSTARAGAADLAVCLARRDTQRRGAHARGRRHRARPSRRRGGARP